MQQYVYVCFVLRPIQRIFNRAESLGPSLTRSMSEERFSLIDTGPFLTIMSEEPPQNVEFYDNQGILTSRSNPIHQ